VISNVPNGQYRVFAKPNYPDGRSRWKCIHDTGMPGITP
jgi:hypothetical protein